MMAVEGKVNPVAAEKHSDRLQEQENELYKVEEAASLLVDWFASRSGPHNKWLLARAVAYATGGDRAVMAVVIDVLERAKEQLP